MQSETDETIEREIGEWNRLYPPGTSVSLLSWDGSSIATKTRSFAELLDGWPCVEVQGIQGMVKLHHCTPTIPPELAPLLEHFSEEDLRAELEAEEFSFRSLFQLAKHWELLSRGAETQIERRLLMRCADQLRERARSLQKRFKIVLGIGACSPKLLLERLGAGGRICRTTAVADD